MVVASFGYLLLWLFMASFLAWFAIIGEIGGEPTFFADPWNQFLG